MNSPTTTEKITVTLPARKGIRRAYLEIELRTGMPTTVLESAYLTPEQWATAGHADPQPFVELSICGTIRYAVGGSSGGQNIDTIREEYGHLPEVARLCDIWEVRHLNGMSPACEHQRAEDWGKEQVEVITYKLTHEAYEMRQAAIGKASAAAVSGVVADLDPTERALLACKWYADIFQPPDADSPLSGCYEVGKRETKHTGWVHPHEHPRGVLGKPCPVCGYKYGNAWMHYVLPAGIIEEVRELARKINAGA